MNTHCQPLPSQVAEELLQVVTRAVCDRPADSAQQRESRTRQMIHSVLGFEPRDGLEYMLATIAYGHFQLILDSMRDAFQGQSEVMKAKNKTTIVALDRMMLQMIKELGLVRRRPMAHSGAGIAEQARAVAASPVGVAAVVESIGAGVAVATSAASKPATSATVRTGLEGTPSDAAHPDMARSDTARPDGAPPSFAAFARTMLVLTGSEAGGQGSAPAVVPSVAAPISPSTPDAFADEISGFLAPPAGEGDAGTFEDHIAAFEDAYAATMETLAEARMLELAKTEAATGD
jgi:hypothetical protein